MNVRRFRFPALAAIVLACAVLAGCTDIHEMKYQSFITAIGLDRTDDQRIKASVLKLLIDRQEQEQGDAGGNAKQTPSGEAKVVSAGCSFFPDCMEKIRHQLSGRMTLDQVHYVLFGEKLLAAGIKPYIDYLYHVGEMEQTVKLFATDQEVETFLRNDNGKLLNRLIGGLQIHPSVYDVEMWEFAPKINTRLRSGIVSSLIIRGNQLYSGGLILLKEDRLGLKLSLDDALLLQLLNKQKVNELTLVFPDDRIAYQVRKYGMKMRVTPESADVYVNVKGWVINGHDNKNRTALTGLDEVISKKIGDRLGQILDKAHAKGIDYLGIGETFRRKSRDTSDWKSRLAKLDVKIHVNAVVLSGKGAQ